MGLYRLVFLPGHHFSAHVGESRLCFFSSISVFEISPFFYFDSLTAPLPPPQSSPPPRFQKEKKEKREKGDKKDSGKKRKRDEDDSDSSSSGDSGDSGEKFRLSNWVHGPQDVAEAGR